MKQMKQMKQMKRGRGEKVSECYINNFIGNEYYLSKFSPTSLLPNSSVYPLETVAKQK